MAAAARELKMSIPSIEWRHAWNRAHSTPGTSWHTMSASYTNREAVYLLRARQQRAALASAGGSVASGAPGAAGPVDAPTASEGREKPLLKAQMTQACRSLLEWRGSCLWNVFFYLLERRHSLWNVFLPLGEEALPCLLERRRNL